MSEWMLVALQEAAQPDHLGFNTIERFKTRLTQRFNENDLQAVSSDHRGLSVLFTGYRDDVPPPNIVAALVTNFQNFETGDDEEVWPEFRATYWAVTRHDVDPEKATYVQRIGKWDAMEHPLDEKRMRRVLSERRGVETVVDLGVGLIRKASNTRAGRVIGAEVQSAVLGFVRPEQVDRGELPIQFGFHPQGVVTTLHGANQVVSLPNFEVAVAQPMLQSHGDQPIAVQKVGRNKRCPCGSGQKFKKCCGA